MPGILSYLRSFRQLAPLPESDGELLQRFRLHRDELAFATLVQRHGSMVLGIARRVLGNSDTTDDVFQATFLVLAQRGKYMETWPSVAGWLVQVARRTALQARSKAARRTRHEQQAAVMTNNSTTAEPMHQASQRDLAELLDVELARLPSKYRTPLVLCQLQGQTKEETARQLGWPVGSVSGRLARGKKLLQDRLLRRGFVPTAIAGVMTVPQVQAHVPSLLIQATTLLASNVVHQTSKESTSAAVALAQGVMTSMFLTKLKYAAVVFMTLALCVGTGAWAWSGKGEAVQAQGQVPRIEAKAGTLLEQIQGLWILEQFSIRSQSNETMDRLLQHYWRFNLNDLETFHQENDYHRRWPMQIDESVSPATIRLETISGKIGFKGEKLTLSLDVPIGNTTVRQNVILCRVTDNDLLSADSKVQPPKIEAKGSSLLEQLQGHWIVDKSNFTNLALGLTSIRRGTLAPQTHLNELTCWKFQENKVYLSNSWIGLTELSGRNLTSFELNSNTTPVRIDLALLYGIVELQAGKLQICFTHYTGSAENIEKARPTQFDDRPNNWLVTLRRATDYDRLEGIWRKEERHPVTNEIENAEELIFKKNMYIKRYFRQHGPNNQSQPMQFFLNETSTPKELDLAITAADKFKDQYTRQLKDKNLPDHIRKQIENEKLFERHLAVYELKDNEFRYVVTGSIPYTLINNEFVPNPKSPLNIRADSFASAKGTVATYKRVERSLKDTTNTKMDTLDDPTAKPPSRFTEPPSTEPMAQLQDLRQQRYKVARERMKLWFEAQASGTRSIDELRVISQQVLDARLALVTDNAEKISAMKEHLKVLNTIEERAKLGIKSGTTTPDEHLAAQLRRIEFEIQLEEMKAKR